MFVTFKKCETLCPILLTTLYVDDFLPYFML